MPESLEHAWAAKASTQPRKSPLVRILHLTRHAFTRGRVRRRVAIATCSPSRRRRSLRNMRPATVPHPRLRFTADKDALLGERGGAMPDARDLIGRTMLVTGANTGIGRAAACALAARGARLWLACRSREKTASVLATILAAGGLAEFVLLDLSDLASVRACAKEVLSKDAPLHVLLNNAGVA